MKLHCGIKKLFTFQITRRMLWNVVSVHWMPLVFKQTYYFVFLFILHIVIVTLWADRINAFTEVLPAHVHSTAVFNKPKKHEIDFLLTDNSMP